MDEDNKELTMKAYAKKVAITLLASLCSVYFSATVHASPVTAEGEKLKHVLNSMDVTQNGAQVFTLIGKLANQMVKSMVRLNHIVAHLQRQQRIV
jgi:hypothetical protein